MNNQVPQLLVIVDLKLQNQETVESQRDLSKTPYEVHGYTSSGESRNLKTRLGQLTCISPVTGWDCVFTGSADWKMTETHLETVSVCACKELSMSTELCISLVRNTFKLKCIQHTVCANIELPLLKIRQFF